MIQRSAMRLPPVRRAATTSAALALLCSGTLAQTNPWFLGLSQSIGQESNMLQIANDQPVPTGFQKSDTVSTTSLQGGFDQRFGRQRAYGGLTLRDVRYDNNSVFDNQGYNGRVGLDWSTVERLSGSVSANVGRSLKSFNTDEIGFISEKNLESVKSLNASLSVGLVTRYSFEFSANRTEVKNSLNRPEVQAREFVQESATLGLQWRPSSATSLGLALGNTRGRYPKFRSTPDGFEADRFKRSDVQVSATYRPSGASSLELRMSSGDTTYDLNEQRNFSGVTGSLVWNWQATGKLSMISTLSRDTGQDSFATSVFTFPATADYSRSNKTVRVQAEYAATAKISLTASLMRYSREVVRTVDNPFLSLAARGNDSTLFTRLGVRWSPLRYLQLGCEHGQERRRSEGQLVSDLDGRSFSCYGQIVLQ